jgi:hypothetical protein
LINSLTKNHILSSSSNNPEASSISSFLLSSFFLAFFSIPSASGLSYLYFLCTLFLCFRVYICSSHYFFPFNSCPHSSQLYFSHVYILRALVVAYSWQRVLLSALKLKLLKSANFFKWVSMNYREVWNATYS